MNISKRNLPNDILSLFTRLDKDAKGSMTTILILAIIHKSKSTWGYQIKKDIQKFTEFDESIKDSSLYTILNSLEKQYKLLESYNEDRRRYFRLSTLGKNLIDEIFSYWENFILLNIKIMDELGIPVRLEGIE